MRHLSLFAGIGATDLAAERCGFQTVATSEIDAWLNDLLRVRFPGAGQFQDVADVRGTDHGLHNIDLISGGFPCPDVSNAGTKTGLTGVRSGLWREFARIIREVEPRYVLAENVAVLKVRGLPGVLNDLHHAGYSVTWDCIPAAALGAPHLRDRIWIKGVREGRDFPSGAWVGHVSRPGSGVHRAGVPLWRMPRSGAVHLDSGQVIETVPQAPIKSCRQFPRPLLGDVRYGAWCRKHMPTPTLSDGTGGPGTTPKRTGGMNLRTYVAQDTPGPLNPDWIEWMMGLPRGWSNPELSNDELVPFETWDIEPKGVPPVDPSRVPHRRARLRALGNALVPQVAEHQIKQLTEGAIP